MPRRESCFPKKETEYLGFDWIWNHLPSLSAYQFMIVVIAGYVGTIGGYTAVYPVFAQYDQAARCVTGLDNNNFSQFNLTFDEIVNITKNTVKDSTCEYKEANYTSCLRFTNKSIFSDCATEMPGEIINCTNVIYDTSSFHTTIKSEFGLACSNHWKNSSATSLSFIGIFFGAMLAGFCSDKYGRKVTITGGIALNAVLWVLQGTVPGYIPYVIIRILVQGANQAAYLTFVCYSCEVVGPLGRKATGMVPNYMFAFGYMFDSLLSYLLPNWRHFTLCLAFLTFPFLLLWPFYPKSPRWLYSVGKYDEGRKVIELFIKNTKTDLSKFKVSPTSVRCGEDEFFRELHHQVTYRGSEERTTEEDELIKKNDEEGAKTYTIISLYTSGPWMAMVSVNICFQFIVIVMVYYGLSFAAGSLPGGVYQNNVISGIVELAAYILCYFTLDILGRKALTSFPMMLAGIAMLIGIILNVWIKPAVCLVEEEACYIDTIYRVLMFGAKFGVSATFSVIWIFAAELYPTVIRTNALSMGSMAGRIGGVIAPQLTGIVSIPWLYPLVFGVSCIISSLTLLFLPETAGKPMMNTMEDVKQFRK